MFYFCSFQRVFEMRQRFLKGQKSSHQSGANSRDRILLKHRFFVLDEMDDFEFIFYLQFI